MYHTSSTGAVPMVRVATAQVHHVNLLLNSRAGGRRRVSWPSHLIACISAVFASGVCSSMHRRAWEYFGKQDHRVTTLKRVHALGLVVLHQKRTLVHITYKSVHPCSIMGPQYITECMGGSWFIKKGFKEWCSEHSAAPQAGLLMMLA